MFGGPPFDEQAISTFSIMCLLLAKTRHRPTSTRDDNAPTVDSGNVGAKYGILSDMYLGDILTLAKAIVIGIESTRSNDKLSLMDLRLTHHDCGVCVARLAASEPDYRKAFEEWARPRKVGLKRPGLFFLFVQQTGSLGCWPVLRNGPSYTELVLDDFHRPFPLAPNAGGQWFP
jgi:hypothetical protein